MRLPAIGNLSMRWKMLLATAVIITVVLAATAWFVEDETVSAMTRDLQTGMQAGFRSYESLWKARSDNLASISTVLSNMSDVRAAFQTGDRATIRDSAAEIWSKVSQSHAFFLVTDPGGGVIASLGGTSFPVDPNGGGNLPIVRAAASRFPAQSEGLSVEGGNLYEVVVTPVYVQTSAPETSLLNVLVTGFPVDDDVLDDLKQHTGGSDFIFRVPGAPVISTLAPAPTRGIASRAWGGGMPRRVSLPAGEFAVLSSRLADIGGGPPGDLLMVRSYEPVLDSIRSLQRRFLWIWGTAIIVAAAISSLIARRILRPIHDLDRAAARIAEQDYSVRVRESAADEVGRLARTFNQMSASIQQAREELIRQERLNTIGRLASSIIHDLRNPLASIYGGAEMLVDGDLNEEQTRRVARNIYRSSGTIKDLLQELAEVSRGRTQAPESCSLHDIVSAAAASQDSFAERQKVTVAIDIAAESEILVERGRMERVFVNLISNAIEAMPAGGRIDIAGRRDAGDILVLVRDTGPGVPESIRDRLFHPFVSGGRNGLGLGLALSRQTVRAQGGDLSLLDDSGPGACFCIRLPVAQTGRGPTVSAVPLAAASESDSSIGAPPFSDEASRLT